MASETEEKLALKSYRRFEKPNGRGVFMRLILREGYEYSRGYQVNLDNLNKEILDALDKMVESKRIKLIRFFYVPAAIPALGTFVYVPYWDKLRRSKPSTEVRCALLSCLGNPDMQGASHIASINNALARIK